MPVRQFWRVSGGWFRIERRLRRTRDFGMFRNWTRRCGMRWDSGADLFRPAARYNSRLRPGVSMKKIYILFFISIPVILTAAVIAAFRYGLVLEASRRVPWMPAAVAISLLLIAVGCGIQYAFGRTTPRRRRLFLSFAVGNGALGLAGLVAAFCSPPTSQMMKWILPGLVIFSFILFKGLVLFNAFKQTDEDSQ